jgi:hypothetical protein
MTKTYIVRFKGPETSVQAVRATTHEVQDGYLLFLDEDGALAALFDMNVVESWFLEGLTEGGRSA